MVKKKKYTELTRVIVKGQLLDRDALGIQPLKELKHLQIWINSVSSIRILCLFLMDWYFTLHFSVTRIFRQKYDLADW